jgi:HEPN domain-containing protein
MERYESWIERAKSSLELAQAKIIRHIHYEDLCFQLQQAAEKALKGLLIYYGFEPEYTHNIEILEPVSKSINCALTRTFETGFCTFSGPSGLTKVLFYW